MAVPDSPTYNLPSLGLAVSPGRSPPETVGSPVSAGASHRHGAHHDAQKFTTTTLPRRLARRTLPPPRAGPETSGAGWRAAGGQNVASANWVPPARLLPWPCVPCPPHAPST